MSRYRQPCRTFHIFPFPVAKFAGCDGDDQVQAGGGNNIILAGGGNDQVQAGSGRDLSIGGTGTDKMVGGGGDDLLVAGFTDWDNDLDALAAEWRSSNSFATRVANMENGTGLNAGYVFNDTTVHDDGVIDELTGSGGTDWFLFNQVLDAGDDSIRRDKVTDATNAEKLEWVDIDFDGP